MVTPAEPGEAVSSDAGRAGIAGSGPGQDVVAETGPGIPDEAVAPGELGPGDLDAAAVERAARTLRKHGWTGGADFDAAAEAQAEAESEAHPS